MTHPDPGPTAEVRSEVLGAVAYGALAAFSRLAADARRAPDLAGRAELASLAAAETARFERVRDELAGRGVDVVDAMAPFVHALDAFAARTTPTDWGEALVAAYVGRTLAVDMVWPAGTPTTSLRPATSSTGPTPAPGSTPTRSGPSRPCASIRASTTGSASGAGDCSARPSPRPRRSSTRTPPRPPPCSAPPPDPRCSRR